MTISELTVNLSSYKSRMISQEISPAEATQGAADDCANYFQTAETKETPTP